MKKKINLIVILMAFCTALLVGLQLYWNYQSYQNDARVFKSDINNALDKAVNRLMDIRRDGFAAKYKQWLSDTSLTEITCRYSDTTKSTIFYLKDRYPPYKNRAPFSISFNFFKQHLNTITPAAKAIFIDHFIKNRLHEDLVSGSAYYYTQNLGDSLANAFHHDKINFPLLKSLYSDELSRRDIENNFNLQLTEYQFKGFVANNDIQKESVNSTQQFKYSFGDPFFTVRAVFPNPNQVFLQKMKWVLLSSLILIGITIACFTFTVRTMLSQNKLTELKDNFVNNMTHELKTPVATISIAAEAIQDFGLNEVSADEYLSIIRYQAGNLTHVIDQILKSMVSEQAMIIINPQVTLLADILNNCVTQYQPQLKAANSSLSLDIVHPFIAVNGDVAHLGNVMVNLLDNAIKYGEEISVIDIQIDTDHEYAVFRITNSGESIPAEYQEKIFDRFFRVPTGNTHNVKGYGLGLSYVREIVRQHKGKITMTSLLSQTTFTIHLPLAKNETAPNIIA